MKKILFAAILIMLSSLAFAQNYSPKKSNVDGRYYQMKSAAGDTIPNLVYIVTDDTLNFNSVGVDSMLAIGDSSLTSLDSLLSIGDSSLVSLDSLLQIGDSTLANLDSLITLNDSSLVSLDSLLQIGDSTLANLDSLITLNDSSLVSLDSLLQIGDSTLANLDSLITLNDSSLVSLDSLLAIGDSSLASQDSLLADIEDITTATQKIAGAVSGTEMQIDIVASGLQDTTIKILRPTVFGHGTKTVTSSAAVLGALFISKVIISNNNASGVAYLGGSGVTTSSYGYKLNPQMAIELEVDNLNDIYVIGDAITLTYVYLK